MKRKMNPRSKLAGYNSRGKIWINKKVKGKDRKRLRVHENTEYKLRQKGMTYKKAHAHAGKVEVKGMSRQSQSKYNGRLGAIARHYPSSNRKRGK